MQRSADRKLGRMPIYFFSLLLHNNIRVASSCPRKNTRTKDTLAFHQRGLRQAAERSTRVDVQNQTERGLQEIPRGAGRRVHCFDIQRVSEERALYSLKSLSNMRERLVEDMWTDLFIHLRMSISGLDK